MAEPTAGDVLLTMASDLASFVPPAKTGLPKPSIAVVQAEMVSAGIGGYVGITTRGAIATVEQHAARMKAVVRFSVWDADPSDLDQAVTALNAAVLAKSGDLATGRLLKGRFLRLTLDGTLASEQTAAGVWRRFADYHVVYELPYEDTGDASSLIVQIPVDEQSTNERWTVTGGVARWDADAAPALRVRGPARITGLAALAALTPPKPARTVTLLRTFDGAPAPPPGPAALHDFIAAVTDPVSPARNLALVLASPHELLKAFSIDSPPFVLGADTLVPRALPFAAPLVLRTAADRLELSYELPAFEHAAVLYLRASRQGD